ncbi:MAG: hypothetical protein NVSMB25_14780 [Thermoleophilaceae bacterium]
MPLAPRTGFNLPKSCSDRLHRLRELLLVCLGADAEGRLNLLGAQLEFVPELQHRRLALAQRFDDVTTHPGLGPDFDLVFGRRAPVKQSRQRSLQRVDRLGVLVTQAIASTTPSNGLQEPADIGRVLPAPAMLKNPTPSLLIEVLSIPLVQLSPEARP